MHWEVQIVGDAADLAMLSDPFTGPAISVEKRGSEYVLRAEELAELDSARVVRSKAEQILSALSGSARLLLGAHTSLKVGAVYKVGAEGGRDVFVSLEPGVLRFRGLPLTIKITRADGSVEVHRPADPVASWVPAAAADQAVAKALRLRDEDDLGWVELVRIYEVIEDDVGLAAIVEKGWASKKAIKRFKHTASSVAAAGDEARHGKERTQPPKRPTPLPEARSLVDGILREWLNYKSNQ